MDLLLVALGAFFFAEFAKTVLPWVLQPPSKLLLVIVAALGIAVAVHGDGIDDRYLIGLTLGGAGLAGLFHKIHRLVSAVGDAQRVAVLTSRPARRV